MDTIPDQKPKLLILQGPTGVGKTEAALALARAIPVEIINADSMQIYRHMDIGTSKPTPEEQLLVPHHLFSIIPPDAQFNAAQFMEQGRRIITAVCGRGKTPLVAGGTGFYIRALTGGLVAAPDGDAQLREQLRSQSRESLVAQLQRVDPETAQRLQPNDLVRIIRALEVFYLTGEPLSQHHRRHNFADEPYCCLKIFLDRDRQSLYRRIEQRVDLMISRGLEQEVRGLLAMGFSPELRPLQSIGYRQMVELIAGRLSPEAAVREMKQATKRFAKRQLTWFRHDPDAVRVVLPDQSDRVLALAKKFSNIA